MKRILCISLLISLCSLTALAQVAGNRNYNQNNQRTPPTTGNIGSNNELFIEAYVLLNVAPDEFVAVFGVAAEAPTAVESNQKVNAQIEQFLTAAVGLGVKRADTFVDFITQNRVYNFSTTPSDATIREILTGFETKKTVAVRYKDQALLERLVTAAAQSQIFDLIKVDYVINDMARIRSRLFDEAIRVVKQKEETYARQLGLVMRRYNIYQETYDTRYPAELYQTYTAYEAGAVESSYDSRTRVVRERKSSTSYLELLDRSPFDAVLNPIGIEPVVQCTLFMRIKYNLA